MEGSWQIEKGDIVLVKYEMKGPSYWHGTFVHMEESKSVRNNETREVPDAKLYRAATTPT